MTFWHFFPSTRLKRSPINLLLHVGHYKTGDGKKDYVSEEKVDNLYTLLGNIVSAVRQKNISYGKWRKSWPVKKGGKKWKETAKACKTQIIILQNLLMIRNDALMKFMQKGRRYHCNLVYNLFNIQRTFHLSTIQFDMSLQSLVDILGMIETRPLF